MTEVKGASQGQRVNLPELLARLADDRELLRDLLSIFKEEDFNAHLRALRGAVAREDMKQAKVVSPHIKGNAVKTDRDQGRSFRSTPGTTCWRCGGHRTERGARKI
jgi:hypothetical protein